MWEGIEDPYEKILQLENQVLQLWIVNEQLSEQLKLQSDLNVKLTEHMKVMSRGMDKLTTIMRNSELRIKILETK